MCRGRDVLVDAKKVGRVVFPFYLGKPAVIVAEGGADHLVRGLAQKIKKVHAARMRLECIIQGPYPSNMPFAFGRIRPLCSHPDVVFCVPLDEGGVRATDPAGRAAVKLYYAGRKRRLHPISMLDKQ